MDGHHAAGRLHLQLWGGSGDSTMDVHAMAQQAFHGVGRVAVSRRGGKYCMAPIYHVQIEPPTAKPLASWQAGHDAFVAALRAARDGRALPPLRLLVDVPPMDPIAAEL